MYYRQFEITSDEWCNYEAEYDTTYFAAGSLRGVKDLIDEYWDEH